MSIRPTPVCLYVSIGEQRLYLYSGKEHMRTFEISTSSSPPSCIENSYGTPLGLHKITDKIGTNAKIGMVFKSRKPTGKCYTEYDNPEAPQNLITTRILRLRGLEAGINQGPKCDTYKRYVYIHGTNCEKAIGRPASAGCILMRNKEVIELYEKVASGSLLLIERSTLTLS